jgi:hypothetical protein
MSPICEWLSRLETLGASPPFISSLTRSQDQHVEDHAGPSRHALGPQRGVAARANSFPSTNRSAKRGKIAPNTFPRISKCRGTRNLGRAARMPLLWETRPSRSESPTARLSVLVLPLVK